MITLCFLQIPFTYFYAEEVLSSEDDIDGFINDGFGSSDEEELVTSGSTKEDDESESNK